MEDRHVYIFFNTLAEILSRKYGVEVKAVITNKDITW